MPLTYITAYWAPVERMEIREGEKVGILIINGSWRYALNQLLPISSPQPRRSLKLNFYSCHSIRRPWFNSHANRAIHPPPPRGHNNNLRPETTAFGKSVGATHTINHH
jgi:hypothetical protein